MKSLAQLGWASNNFEVWVGSFAPYLYRIYSPYLALSHLSCMSVDCPDKESKQNGLCIIWSKAIWMKDIWNMHHLADTTRTLSKCVFDHMSVDKIIFEQKNNELSLLQFLV